MVEERRQDETVRVEFPGADKQEVDQHQTATSYGHPPARTDDDTSGRGA
jgi:hypothetical protein